MCLGCALGLHLSLERGRRARETLVDPEFPTGVYKGAEAHSFEEENMKLSGDLPGNLGTDICEVLGMEFIPPRPQVLGRRSIRYPHVDPQHPGPAVLGTTGDHVLEVRCLRRCEVAHGVPLVRRQCE